MAGAVKSGLAEVMRGAMLRAGSAPRADERGSDSAESTESGVRLNEAEVYQLLDIIAIERCATALLPADAGVAERDRWASAAADLAGAEGRLVLKILGRTILHKSDTGGVRVLSFPTAGREVAILAAAQQLLTDVGRRLPGERLEGVLACAFIPHRASLPGQELLLSMRQDPAFGPVVVVGVGGLLTEWYSSGTMGRSRLIFPAENLQPMDVARALAVHPLLAMLTQPSRLYREPPLSIETVTHAVCALGELGCAFGAAADAPLTLEEIEINPAVASQGRLVAVDGLGLVSRRRWSPARRPLPKIERLLSPRSAAVIGVSARGANPGRIILGNLLRSTSVMRERLWVVHQQESMIDGVPCVAAVRDLPEKVDLAVVAVPAAAAPATIAELAGSERAESIILIPGGFAETGATDLADAITRTMAAAHVRRDGGPVLVGGNCLGIVSRDRYNTFFLPPYKLPFRDGRGANLALVSQSGAYLVTFASNYDGVIFPRASISFGNQMDLTVADFLTYFLDESDVDVIACYVEGFQSGDGARFLAAARVARSRGKRVIIFKAGRTALGARAAASHTASLAGDYDVAAACLSSAGVAVASTLNEFEDLIKTFTLLHQRPALGRRVGVFSNAGFECTAVTDALDGLELARFDPATRAELAACLPPYAHSDNPIDATPIADTATFARACAAVLACPGVDCAILSTVPATPALDNLPVDPQARHGEDIERPGSQPRRLIELWERSNKPAVVVIDAGRLYDPMCEMLERAGIPVFRKIDRASRALSMFCRDVSTGW